MSTDLSWEPKNREKTYLCYELKLIFRKRIRRYPYSELTEQDISYFEGIVDASENEKIIEQTEALIEAIRKYQIIVLEEA